jgi:hypothetical protein
MPEGHVWEVQVGKGKGSYRTKYTFHSTGIHDSRAWLHFASTHVHSGHKKRLRLDGQTIARTLT